MKPIDLRSDTLTLPDAGMRRAMAEAEVGDDVYGEDPTINNLQELAAEITGKEAAIFVTSGSMGNLVPIMINCPRGSEIIAHKDSHILHFEMSSLASIAGAMPVPIDGEDGKIAPDKIAPKLRPDIYYLPRTGMLEIENTHNLAGGTFYNRDELKAVSDFAKQKNLPLHMDGARVFNASAASGISVKEICSCADTVTFCLSKGLGAPAGSLLCGEKEFIKEARRVRKLLGGGMRQAGILAAAGIYALKNNPGKLIDDHLRAKRLATALKQTDYAIIASEKVCSNILYFQTKNHGAPETVAAFKNKGLLCSAIDEIRVRMVTCLDLGDEDIDRACEIIKSIRF